MGEWKPIETAPKDGTVVLLFVGRGVMIDFTRTAYVGSWREGGVGEPQQDYIGWRALCCGRWHAPTHWQPLPAPPEQENG